MGTKDQTQAIIDAQASRQKKQDTKQESTVVQKRGAELREEMIESQAKGEQYRAEHAGADQRVEGHSNHAQEREQKRIDSSETGRVLPAHERGTH
ncbi:MAG: hypothetical protein KF681_00965 [Bdellovibrionaceae bacterium]|nr:hypothetical protein [Pseudobdellovibrionaceae bacterium]